MPDLITHINNKGGARFACSHYFQGPPGAPKGKNRGKISRKYNEKCNEKYEEKNVETILKKVEKC